MTRLLLIACSLFFVVSCERVDLEKALETTPVVQNDYIGVWKHAKDSNKTIKISPNGSLVTYLYNEPVLSAKWKMVEGKAFVIYDGTVLNDTVVADKYIAELQSKDELDFTIIDSKASSKTLSFVRLTGEIIPEKE